LTFSTNINEKEVVYLIMIYFSQAETVNTKVSHWITHSCT